MSSKLLTFMFTDLAASTRLWEQLPDSMGDAVQRHFDILGAAVDGHGGKVVKMTGDGLLAVFPSPAEAVKAGLVAQQALVGEDWGDTGPLRVRMGLHLGEAEPRGGDYYGPAVNRAARIMSAGHGGQVLLSGSVAGLVRDRLPDGAGLRDLGEHRLKDLAEPERLFQLEAPDLSAGFPPLLTLSARPNNLPSQAHPLLGRRTELAEVSEMIVTSPARLVTLTGPGGTGKTRLALQVAAETIEAFDDGVFFVDLSELRSAEAVFETSVRVLGASGVPSDTALGALVEHLKRRKVLVIFDNLEQVADAAPGVAPLLAGAPDLSVLATSREALHIRGEHLYPVPPLSLPDQTRLDTASESEAVSLFVARARAVLPSFRLDGDNLPTVVEICIRLDGLPLAIELAAARLRILSPHDLLARLQRRLDVLRGGARDLPARQQTLRDTIDWSYELLQPEEQALFRTFSVFSSARFESDGGTAVTEGGLTDSYTVRLATAPRDGDSVVSQIDAIATKLYGAAGIDLQMQAVKDLEQIERLGLDRVPVCMAKTHLSISHDPSLRNRPRDFVLPVRALVPSAGAGFVVALCGEMQRMPGLGKTLFVRTLGRVLRRPALQVDIDDVLRPPKRLVCRRQATHGSIAGPEQRRQRESQRRQAAAKELWKLFPKGTKHMTAQEIKESLLQSAKASPGSWWPDK